MTFYSYIKKINPEILLAEIEVGLGFAAEFINNNEFTTAFDVYFTTALTGGEVITLNAVVAAHQYSDDSGNGLFVDLSATTIFSAGTNLDGIFQLIGTDEPSVLIQPGANILTGGTSQYPVIGLTASPSVNNITFSGTAIGGNVQASDGAFTSLSAETLSGGTILSGGTNLYSIFSTTDTNDITRVQPGSNITTGGTANAPTINLAVSPSVNNLTFSGAAIGGSVQASDGTFTSLSAETLSGGTILSGGTNLYSIFSTTDTNDITRVQPGNNITTGGTANAPSISLTASPSVNNLTFSGSAIGGNVQAAAGTFTSLSATTLSGGTILSGGTNLYSIFAVLGGSGEVNTASSVGNGNSIFKQKSGVDLQFRSLSAGTNITITTGDTITINSTASGSGGSSRITGSTTTSNATPTVIATISTLKDNATNFIDVYVKAYQASAAQYGIWKRTLAVTKVSGTPVIQFTDSDSTSTSSGLKSNSVTFAVSGGNITISVTGIAATTIGWESAYEIIL